MSDRVMAKFYKKRVVHVNRDKYSVEHSAGTISCDSTGNGGVAVVPSTPVQGMRKVKHLTISVADFVGASSANVLWWALVYVPQGTTANTLSINSTGLYEPNQYVMGCGVFDFTGGPLRVRCPLSRNLNSGDSIALVVYNAISTGPAASTFAYNISYAITLQ